MENISLMSYIAIFALFYVKFAEGGECCRAHYDVIGQYQGQKWCSDYCCFSLGKYDCCDNVLLQAPASERTNFCAVWFTAHIWAPITVSVVVLLLIIGCCVCCCRMCCGRSGGRTVIVQGGQQPAAVMVQNTQMSQNSMYNAGYNQ